MFPHVVLRGGPGPRGEAYARQAEALIQASLVHYRRRLPLPWSRVRELVRQRFLASVAEHLPEALEEMEGLARGVGVPLEDILALNARYELLREEACTTVVCLAQATGGPVLLAQNWDFHPSVLHTAVILEVRPLQGPASLLLAEAGQVGRFGLSEQGLGIAVNGLDADLPRPSRGVPVSLLRRAFLDCSSLDEGSRLVKETPRTVANNVLLASANGDAVDLELGPEWAWQLPPRDGLLAHANRFRAAAMAGGPPPGPVDRAERVVELLMPWVGRITASHLWRVLSDHLGYPASICRHDTARPSITAASAVMDLAARRLSIVRGPPCRGRAEVFQLAA